MNNVPLQQTAIEGTGAMTASVYFRKVALTEDSKNTNNLPILIT